MRILLFLVFFNLTSYLQAATIDYEATNIAGNQWQYSYFITNDSLSVDIEEFLIFFDANSFSNLQLLSTPSDWDPILIQPDILLPDDGYYDALALIHGISPNSSLSGFSVQFNYLLSDIPGSQYFEIRDSITFGLLESGNTERLAEANIPEPNSLLILIQGIGLLIMSTRKKRKV